MLILLTTIVVLIISIVVYINWECSFLGMFASALIVVSCIGLVIEGGLIIGCHIGVKPQIQQNETQYLSLIERREIAQSEYEDYSRSDVVRDIAEWNKNAISAQYWGHSPWTNWFYSQRVVDSLKIIE